MPAMTMLHEVEPSEELFDRIGDLSNIDIFNNQVLCAIYIRPTKTKSGIIITDQTRAEDKFQGKVGLVLKKGTRAFRDDGEWFEGVNVVPGDWVFFRVSDGWPISINGVECRLLDDTIVRGKIDHPDRVW
jgi:co-chaperonin GroES (HSP10)